jgi:hypothetical protein
MNCFPAENAPFSVYLLTLEEGLVAFLNVSIGQVENDEVQMLDDCGY